jgi:hypothetical protein
MFNFIHKSVFINFTKIENIFHFNLFNLFPIIFNSGCQDEIRFFLKKKDEIRFGAYYLSSLLILPIMELTRL